MHIPTPEQRKDRGAICECTFSFAKANVSGALTGELISVKSANCVIRLSISPESGTGIDKTVEDIVRCKSQDTGDTLVWQRACNTTTKNQLIRLPIAKATTIDITTQTYLAS